MKKVLVFSLFLAGVTGAFAQAITFANTVTFSTPASVSADNGKSDRLVYWTDNTTGLSGTNWSAQLYWTSGSGQPAGSLAFDSNAIDSAPKSFFSSGSQLGKWQPAGKTFTGAASGDTVTLQVRVWDGSLFSSYGAAKATGITGASPTFNYTIPAGGSAATAFYMEGLQSFTVHPAPEPTTIALGLLGAASLLVGDAMLRGIMKFKKL